MNHSNKKQSLTSKWSSKLSGSTPVDGDKSISHRSLIISSQALGTSEIIGLLESEDVLNTLKILQELGVSIEKKDDKYLVHGAGMGSLTRPEKKLDAGNSGTGVRLLMGLVSSFDFEAVFTGDESLCKRPMGRVTRPLSLSGANFSSEKLPVTVKGSNQPISIEYKMEVASAQVKSAIILAALNISGTSEIIETEKTRDHTEIMLKYFGFDIKQNGTKIEITGGKEVKAKNISVPGDPSSAAFLTAAALIIPDSEITIENICINPLRIGFYEVIKEMGADIEFINKREICGEMVADIKVKYSKLHGIDIPAFRAPSMIDEYPIISILAAAAEGKTKMNGLAELKVKESNRLGAIFEGLENVGIKAIMGDDCLEVEGVGGNIKNLVANSEIKTYTDHRIAMSFLVLGMRMKEGVTIDDASMIKTSFPNFVPLMKNLGAVL